MRSDFNLLFFPNSMFTPFFILKGYVLSGEIALKYNYYYYYHRYIDIGTKHRLIAFKRPLNFNIF